jgi:hypothetical protein
MDGSIIGTWIGIAIIFFGLIGTWVKNGKKQSEERGKMEERVKDLTNKIDLMSISISGVDGIREIVNKQAVNCAKISSTFEVEIKNLKKQVENKGRKK